MARDKGFGLEVMRIRTRIKILILVNVFVFVLVVGGSIFVFLGYKKAINEVISEDLEFYRDIEDWRVDLFMMRRNEKNFLLFQDRKYIDFLKEAMVAFEKSISTLKGGLIADSEYKQLIDIISDHSLQYMALLRTIEDIPEREYLQFTVKARDMSDEISTGLDKLEERIIESISGKLSNQLHAQIYYITFVFSGLIVVMLVWLIGGFLFWHSTSNRLDRLEASARHIMTGEYQPLMETGPIDEIGEITLAFNEMQQRISEREERLEKLNTDLVKLTNQLKRG